MSRFGSLVTLASLLVSSIACGACSARPDAVEAVASPRGAGGAATVASAGWLVWTHADDGTMHTALVDATSKVVSEAPTMVTAVDGTLWALTRTRATRELQPCEGGFEHPDPSVDEKVSLVPLDDARPPLAIAPAFVDPGAASDDDTGVGTVVQTVDVVGSVGPYVFAHDAAWTFSCGAHGNWFQTAHVLDVRSGREIELAPTDLEAAERAARARFVAMAEADEGIGSLWEGGAPASVDRVALEPRLDGGRIRFVHVFLAEAPYVYGASEWRSYAAEAEVAAATPSTVRGEDTALPRPVAAYVGRLGKTAHFGGFSEVDDADAAAATLTNAPAIAPRPSR